MANMADIRDGLKTTVSNISGLRCYDVIPDNAINFPVAIFIPTNTYTQKNKSLHFKAATQTYPSQSRYLWLFVLKL